MSKATSSQGVKVLRGGLDSTSPMTAIVEINTFTGPKKSLKDIDVTSLDSAAKEYQPGLVDYGELAVNGNYVGDDAQHQGLDDDMDNRVVRYWQVQLNDADGVTFTTPTSWTFQGYVKGFDIKGGVDKVVEFSGTIKITGKPTRVPRS